MSVAHGADVNLSSVIVRGPTVYQPAELFAVYGKDLGKPLDAALARAIVAGLLAKYETDGYSRPQLRIDDGLASAGILRIDVLEPRIAAVTINGNPGPHLERLSSLGQRLRDDGPLRPSEMQATLRRMRALPGLTLSASTAAEASDPRAYRLDLDTDFEPVSGLVRVTNRGTDEAGPNFVLGQLMANGLLDGRTSLGGLFSAATDYDEYHGFGLLAQVDPGAGERLAFSAFRSRSDPRELVDRDDTYLRDRVTLGMNRPISAFERGTASWSATLDIDDLEIRRAGQRLRDERLRMLELGARFGWRAGAKKQFAASVEIVKGLDAFGSALLALDLSTDPRSATFLATRTSLTMLTRMSV
jgi:hemolysin activation/secretion protein